MKTKKMLLYTAPVALAGFIYLGGANGVGEVFAKIVTTMTRTETKVLVTMTNDHFESDFLNNPGDKIYEFAFAGASGENCYNVYQETIAETEVQTEVADDVVISEKKTPSKDPDESLRKQKEAEEQRREEAAKELQRAAEKQTEDFVNEIQLQIDRIRQLAMEGNGNTGSNTAVIRTTYFTCFTENMMKLLKANPDITYEIHYRYQGKNYVLVIPAGADLDSLKDSNGYYGFRYLDSVFGGYEEKA